MKRETILFAAAEAAYNVGVALDRAAGESPLLWDELLAQDQAAHLGWTEAILTAMRQPEPDALHELARAAAAKGVARALGFDVVGNRGPDRIVVATARAFGVTLAEIRGSKRLRHIVRARHVAMFLYCRAGFSTTAAGQFCGHADHTTVISARNKIARLVETDAEIGAQVGALAAALEIRLSAPPAPSSGPQVVAARAPAPDEAAVA